MSKTPIDDTVKLHVPSPDPREKQALIKNVEAVIKDAESRGEKAIPEVLRLTKRRLSQQEGPASSKETK